MITEEFPPVSDTVEEEEPVEACTKCTACNTVCPVARSTEIFRGPKFLGPESERFRSPLEPAVTAGLDLCSGCKLCEVTCPSQVSIQSYIRRAQNQGAREHGRTLRDWVLGHTRLLSAFGSWTAPLANFGNHNPLVRWLMERLVGIHRKRPLPRYQFLTFERWFRRRHTPTLTLPQRGRDEKATLSQRGRDDKATVFQSGRDDKATLLESPRDDKATLTESGSTDKAALSQGGREQRARKVAYFYGCWVNYNDRRLGELTVKVLERNGIEVVVPRQQCCGIPAVVNSDMDTARRYGAENVRRFTPIAEEMDIVASSTSCGLMLKHDYAHLLDIPGAERVGARVYDICEYLWMLHEAGELDLTLEPVPMRLLYHAPCHLKSHGIGYPAMRLLRLIPQVRLEEVDEGCCGISGTFGVKVEKYDLSMQIGSRLFAAVRAAGSDAVLADCETCRMQVEHGAGAKSQHPIEVLAAAYRINHG